MSQASTPGRGPVGTPRQSSLRFSAEAMMLSGSPARAAYKRAFKTAATPPQSWPELLPPAGMPWTDRSSPRREPLTHVSELVAMHHASGAEKLCAAPVYGDRFAYKVPKPLPVGPAEVIQKLGVSIISARGLRNADNVKVMAEGLSDPYCTCEIPGKPHSKIQTHVVRDKLDPEWHYMADVRDFAEGDSLRFCVYDYDAGEEHGDLLGTVTLQSPQFYPAGFEGELALADAGEGIRAFLKISIVDVRERERELNIYGGACPEDALTAAYVRKFMLCARRLGARGLPRLGQALKAAAASDGTLDEQSFQQIAMAEGLCRFFEGCNRIFGHFKLLGNGIVHVDTLMKCARGIMESHRLEAVREVWNSVLDPHGRGFVEVASLVAAFDPRRLPAVQYDGLSLDMARREYLEGLGACRFTVACKNDAFALDEAAAGRRALPVGAPAPDVRIDHRMRGQGGGAVFAQAGKAGLLSEVFRGHGDMQEEVQSRPTRVLMDARISAMQFEDYYTALSHGITNDRIFDKTLRDPWTGQQVHDHVMAHAWNIGPNRKAAPKPPQFRISATFADGSRRVVPLSNIDGLSEAMGHAGVHCSQMWTWGPGIKEEVVRRLEAEGVSGVVQVKPIPC